MDRETIQEYTIRVTQSNRTELVVTIYDLIILSIREAKEFAGQKDVRQYRQSLGRAQGLIKELISALDFKYSISGELLSLYMFVNRKITKAVLRNRPEELEGLDRVINNLREAFAQLKDDSGPVMSNTQKVYAGLTYGRTSLTETISEDSNRGFKA